MNRLWVRLVAIWLLAVGTAVLPAEETYESIIAASQNAQGYAAFESASVQSLNGLAPPAPPASAAPVYTDALLPATPSPFASPAAPRPPPVAPTPPKYPELKFTGVIQLDGIWSTQETSNINAVLPGPVPLGDIQDSLDFRRALLGVRGDVSENINFALDVDFGLGGRPTFQDVWIETTEYPIGNIRVGSTRQPVLMDALTSLRELIFLERPTIFSFVPFYQTGVLLYGTAQEETVTYAVSGYRFPGDAFGGTLGDNGYGFASRATTLLVEDPQANWNVHLGGSFSHNQPVNHSFRFRSQPEVGATFGGSGVPPVSSVPFFVDTGAINTDWYNLYGMELAASLGPILFQSESMFNQVSLTTGSNALFFATYAQLSYVLTGEGHPYHKKNAVFTRVIPEEPFGKGGIGAWEVAARLSHIDLNDDLIAGGRLTDFTAGVNWYLNKNTRIIFNYIHAWLDNPTNGDSGADLFAIRAQLDF